MNKSVKTVVFLGPDGAGKSTLIGLVERDLKMQGLDFATYYFAPGFLKRYRPSGVATITTNPHEGRQYGAGLVFAKILLMLFEFNFGLPKVKRRNAFVLFDRFIHDLLVDPRRYRMGRVRWWMTMMLRFAPRADLYITIIAPPAVIQARKQEVSEEETERQVKAYQAIAERFRSSLVVENVGPPEDISARIVSTILGR